MLFISLVESINWLTDCLDPFVQNGFKNRVCHAKDRQRKAKYLQTGIRVPPEDARWGWVGHNISLSPQQSCKLLTSYTVIEIIWKQGFSNERVSIQCSD